MQKEVRGQERKRSIKGRGLLLVAVESTAGLAWPTCLLAVAGRVRAASCFAWGRTSKQLSCNALLWLMSGTRRAFSCSVCNPSTPPPPLPLSISLLSHTHRHTYTFFYARYCNLNRKFRDRERRGVARKQQNELAQEKKRGSWKRQERNHLFRKEKIRALEEREERNGRKWGECELNLMRQRLAIPPAQRLGAQTRTRNTWWGQVLAHPWPHDTSQLSRRWWSWTKTIQQASKPGHCCQVTKPLQT